MNKTLIFWVVVLGLEFLFIITLINPSYVKGEFRQEIKSVVHWFGKTKTEDMYRQSQKNYKSLFVESGVKQASYDWLLPKSNQELGIRNEGIKELGNAKIWKFIKNRLDAFWNMVKSSLFRFEVLLICFMHSIPLLVPAAIDGLMQREVTKRGSENASINFYTQSKNVLFTALILPPILLIWPMAISPIYVGWWALILVVSIWLTAANTQHRV